MLSIYTNPIFYGHNTGAGHPESAARLDAALRGIDRAGFADRVNRETDSHPDTDRIIAKVHSADYERALEQAARSGMDDFLSGDNPMSRFSPQDRTSSSGLPERSYHSTRVRSEIRPPRKTRMPLSDTE